jgi:hypothetical protein
MTTVQEASFAHDVARWMLHRDYTHRLFAETRLDSLDARATATRVSDVQTFARLASQLDGQARTELAALIRSPARSLADLDDLAASAVAGFGQEAANRVAAIVVESPDAATLERSLVDLISVYTAPKPAVPTPTPAVQRTDGRIELEEVIRLDSAAKPEEDDTTDEDRLKKARRTGRTEANRALREILAGTALEDAEDDDELDESGTSGTDEDDQSGTRTDARNGNTMSNRRDDIRTISQPRSPSEQIAARERLTRSVADEVRADHRADAADDDPEKIDRAVQRDPAVRAAHDAETAAHGAMQRRAMSVGRTPTTRTDAREQPRGTYASPSAQRKRFGLDRDGDGGNEAA